MRQPYKMAGIGLYIILFGVSGKVLCHGQGENSLSLTTFEYSNDGGQTSIVNAENGGVAVHYDANGLSKGYYTAFIYTKKIASAITLQSVDTMQLAITADTSLKMNVNVITATGVTHKCKDDSAVYSKEHSNAYYKPVTVENGTFTIKEGFDGVIYIPYESLSIDDGEKEAVSTIGVTLTVAEQETADVTFHSIKYGIRKEFDTISGSRTVQIPPAGEFYYQYSAENGTGYYTLEEQEGGCSITKQGLLTVEEDCLGKNTILLYNTDDLVYGYPLSFEATKGIPAKDGLNDYGYVKETEGIRKQGIFWLRLASAGLALCYAVFYMKRVRKG